MPPQDAALMLLTSLTGEAELEVEHLDLKRVHDRNGVQYLLDTLRQPLQQKQLFQKRTLLDSFEKSSRFPNESLRQYIDRYSRVEKDLEAIGMSSSTSTTVRAKATACWNELAWHLTSNVWSADSGGFCCAVS